MKYTSLLRRQAEYSSIIWHDSKALEGVRYSIRRVSLSQRLELTKRVRELVLRQEFLNAGNTSDQLESSLADLLARKLYLEWGLVQINGLTIDGQPATAELLVEKGPEPLGQEIIAAIQSELGLSEEERKNS